MKFTLHYDGSLPSSGNKGTNQAKWDIRKRFHPQLVDLWASHPALQAVEANRHFPMTGGMLIQGHHMHPGPIKPPFVRIDQPGSNAAAIIDLNADIDMHGAKFRPLVRKSYALHCGLTINFQRKEPPGKVYQGGDLDGRLKTLIDALAMPQHLNQVVFDPTAPDLIYCLMEDNSMVSELSIKSERLLTDDDMPAGYVRLNIEVDVRVRLATIYNQSFLG